MSLSTGTAVLSIKDIPVLSPDHRPVSKCNDHLERIVTLDIWLVFFNL